MHDRSFPPHSSAAHALATRSSGTSNRWEPREMQAEILENSKEAWQRWGGGKGVEGGNHDFTSLRERGLQPAPSVLQTQGRLPAGESVGT